LAKPARLARLNPVMPMFPPEGRRATTAWRWIDVTRTEDPGRLRLAPVLAEVVAESAVDGRPAVLVRSQPRYLLLGPRDRRLPRVGEAVRRVEESGVPVFMRIGGGSAVLLDDRCLSFAAARPCRDLTQLERNFRELARGAARALQRLGLPVQFGAAPGSYCEGPWDLVVRGRKVAGIAQAIRRGYTVVSGMILVDQDPESTTAFVQQFYDWAGSTQVLRAGAVTSLAAELGRRVSQAELVEALRAGFSETLPLEPSALTAEEWQRAEALYPLRQFPSPSAVSANL